MAVPLLSKASHGTLDPYTEGDIIRRQKGGDTSSVPSILQAAKPFQDIHLKSTVFQKLSLMSSTYYVG